MKIAYCCLLLILVFTSKGFSDSSTCISKDDFYNNFNFTAKKYAEEAIKLYPHVITDNNLLAIDHLRNDLEVRLKKLDNFKKHITLCNGQKVEFFAAAPFIIHIGVSNPKESPPYPCNKLIALSFTTVYQSPVLLLQNSQNEPVDVTEQEIIDTHVVIVDQDFLVKITNNRENLLDSICNHIVAKINIHLNK